MKKEWKHWRKTFNNHVADDGAVSANVFLSFTVYEHVDECQTYCDAVYIPDSLFTERMNEIFDGNLLMTAKQQPGKSLEEYLQEL